MIKQFKVEGMHCSSCEVLVREEIEELSGIKSVKASHESNMVVVEYDDRETTDSDLRSAIIEAGYKVI